MIFDGYVNQLPDSDPGETSEWLDSLDAVIDSHASLPVSAIEIPRLRPFASTCRPRCAASTLSHLHFPASWSMVAA